MLQAAAGSVDETCLGCAFGPLEVGRRSVRLLPMVTHRSKGVHARKLVLGRDAAAVIGRGPHVRAVHRDMLDRSQPGREAPLDHALERLAHQAAVAEAPAPVLGEGGTVRRPTVQPQAAEPAIGQVELDLLAQAALRAGAEQVARQQHADHRLGTNGRDGPRRRGAGPGVRARSSGRGSHRPGAADGLSAPASPGGTHRTAPARSAVPSSHRPVITPRPQK